MWFLECNGNVLDKKRIWLRPGKCYLFGRTKPAEAPKPNQHNYIIDNKSVSRKHLTISVGEVPSGNATRVHEKSTCTIQDESRIGTYLNGENMVKESRVLTRSDNSLQLGSFNQTFKIFWHPTVLTFSFTSKQQERTRADVFESYRPLLEPLDIKFTNEFLVNETTHVVSGKRNHQRALLALLNARYLVTDPFLDAVVRASETTVRPGIDPHSPQSPLEMDFDATWPDAMQYVPPAGKEPHPCPAAMFSPNPDRLRVFEGLSFVFADDSQHSNLQSVVNNGSAKCYNFPLRRNETLVKDFVAYMRNISGEKGLSGSSGTGDEIGVIFVRFPVQGDSDKWAISFIREVDRALGQRSIEQNEFLEAIVQNDASNLKRALEEEKSTDTDVTSTAASTRALVTSSIQFKPLPSSETPTEESGPTPQKPRARRTLAQSRFKGWDELDEEPIRPRKDPERIVTNAAEPDTRQNTRNTDSQGLFVNESDHFQDNGLGAGTRKRASPPSDDEDTGLDHQERMMDALLPAKAALKRRRLEDERLRVPSATASRSLTADPDMKASKPKALESKPPKKDIEVRTVARSRATEVDKRPKGKSSRLHSETQIKGVQEDEVENDYNDIDPNVAYSLAAIAEMEITPRNDMPASAAQRREAAHNERWDNRWNGRKDFKGFRRQRARDNAPNVDGVNVRGHRRVIVALEPAKKKDYGIGEHYWVTNRAAADSGDDQNSEDDEDALRARSKAKSRAHSQAQIQNQDKAQRAASSRSLPVMIDDNNSDSDDAGYEGTAQTWRENLPSVAKSSQLKNGKRHSATNLTTKPPAKRQKQSRLFEAKEDDGDEDDDELKFKSKRRR